MRIKADKYAGYFLIESYREYGMIKKAGGMPAERRKIYVKKHDCFVCL